MPKGLLTMSTKEVDRGELIRRVREKRLTQAKAAALLGLSVRQVKRLCQRFKTDGLSGLASRQRGRPSNRKLSVETKAEVVALVRERYADFGPKLAHEKLVELHGIRIGRETVRGWLSEAGIWLPRAARTLHVHQPRHRRQCLGELVQIDGCDHEWFEARADRCTALVYVDDATGRLMELRFVVSESAFDYFAATESYLGHHGKPVAFYSDKHSIFRVNQEGTSGRSCGITQFGRALGVLNIDIICANTPQAKGRVERMNKTLQDRLVKEMRLRASMVPVTYREHGAGHIFFRPWTPLLWPPPAFDLIGGQRRLRRILVGPTVAIVNPGTRNHESGIDVARGIEAKCLIQQKATFGHFAHGLDWARRNFCRSKGQHGVG
jgi:transposase